MQCQQSQREVQEAGTTSTDIEIFTYRSMMVLCVCILGCVHFCFSKKHSHSMVDKLPVQSSIMNQFQFQSLPPHTQTNASLLYAQSIYIFFLFDPALF